MKDALGAVQSVLVLGGSSEIGVAVARALAGPRHARVILAGRHPDALEDAAADVKRAGAASVDLLTFDALATDTHQAFVEDVAQRFGDIDVAVIAFGVLGDQEAAEKDPAAALEIANTNYTGVVSIAIPLAQQFRTQGHGTIVLLSTVAGERARRSNFIYGSSKAGADAFAQGLSDALVGSGASVLVVRPGFVRTKMTAGMKAAPLSTTPEAVADVVVRGLQRGDHTVWAPAPLRWVMTILRHVPRPVFRRLPI
ncbi:MAG: decaprenylphospho-beta-D-erythro-pentofuranosid-2-ulose 2-reductase [Acidimicrobiaceae bacterium]|nr:decaprenylphospho-beta-D-erythro-pentofuranosid-2-ulose 2-reductase [Acidimicrobiaceae bacterium]